MPLKPFGVIILLLLTACSTPPTTLPLSSTPDPIQAYVEANSSQATAVAAVSTAQFFGSQLTATVEVRNQIATDQAWSLQSTQQAANILATQQTWNTTVTAGSAQATAIASQTASAAAVQSAWTQRAVNITATTDSASAQAFATSEFARSKSVELGIERETMMNKTQAIVPWVGLIFTFALLMFMVFRWTRVRVIQRAPNGDAPLLLDVVDSIAYDADRHPSSTAGLMRRDLKKLPQFSSGEHLKITTQDQMLDMTSRGSHDAARKAITSSTIFNTGTPPQIQILDSTQARPLFQDVIPHLLQDSIEADLIKDNNEGETNG